MHEISIAEKEGMSFQTRCAEATVALERHRELFQKLSTEDLRFRQAREERIKTFLENVNEVRREAIAGYLSLLRTTTTEDDATFYKGLWEHGLVATRRIYGTDAVEIALQTFNARRGGN